MGPRGEMDPFELNAARHLGLTYIDKAGRYEEVPEEERVRRKRGKPMIGANWVGVVVKHCDGDTSIWSRLAARDFRQRETSGKISSSWW